MLNLYQHLPSHINPIAFNVGVFSIRWYSLGYLAGFIVVYCLLRYRITRGEFDVSKFSIFNFQFSNKSKIPNPKIEIFILDFMLYAVIGLLIGARIGYVLFYNLPHYISHPLEIIYPFDISGNYVGISGMSYFGGVIGIILVGVIFARKYKISFWQLADFVIPAIPAGYFFGRIGNFLNGELYGRITQKPWGMYFSADPSGLLRHPSQLYEAFFEGLVIFAILWTIRNKSKFPGQLLFIYLTLYGFFRFFIEFFREPDPQIGFVFGFLTLGQIFSLLFMTAVMITYFLKKNRKS